jgi:hypothetical protein
MKFFKNILFQSYAPNENKLVSDIEQWRVMSSELFQRNAYKSALPS